MLRKLLVNVMALFAVLVVAGGAMAAVSTLADSPAEEEAPEDAPEEARERAAEVPVDDEGGQLQARSDDSESAALAAEDWDTGEFDNFGAARSAQVHAYQACRKSGAEDCEKPGPAHQNPYHPKHRDDSAEESEELEAARTGAKPAKAGGKGKKA